MKRKLVPLYLKKDSVTLRRIKFKAFCPDHEGVIVTAAGVQDTIEELQKDYIVVMLQGVMLVDNGRESVKIYNSDTKERIY
jgi:hypothetical protein